MSIESRKQLHEQALGQGWKLAEYLGRGSFGVTYRIERENRGWKEEGALKVIDILGGREPEPSDELLEKERGAAENEIRLMYRLRGCPNIVHYLGHYFVNWNEAGERGCDLLIQMDLLTPLRKRMKEKVFSEAEIRAVGLNICDALIYCKKHDVLHRDIKPDNIFYSGSVWQLGDFGISRILGNNRAASTAMGTWGYVAPEQIRPRAQYDDRADLYSLALTLYELANHNRLPFAAEANPSQEAVDARLSGDPMPAPDGVSAAFGAVLLKALSFDPADRYPDAAAFRAALESGGEESVFQKTVTAVPSAPRPQKARTIPEVLDSALQFRRLGQWDKAAAVCDAVLKKDPAHADASLGKLLAVLHLVNEEDLADSERDLEAVPEFHQAREAADIDRAVRLGQYAMTVRERLAEKQRMAEAAAEKRERQRGMDVPYRTAVDLMTTAQTEKDYREAAAQFLKLEDYRDAPDAAQKCLQAADAMHKDRRQAKWKKRRPYIAAITAAVLLLCGISVYRTMHRSEGTVHWDYHPFTKTLTFTGTGRIDPSQQWKKAGYSDSMRRVVIEDGITEIGYGAFGNCTALEEISIPDSVTQIGDQAFSNCPALADENGMVIVRDCLYDCFSTDTQIVIPDGVEKIGASAFTSCGAITSVTLPQSVSVIGERAFAYSRELTDISIPEGVTLIDDSAFYECDALTSVTIPETVGELGMSAFYGCDALRSVSVPESTVLGYAAFGGCPALADGDGMVIVNHHLFDYTGTAEHVVIPDGVTQIGTSAFARCESMVSVSIPDSVTLIGDSAFTQCENLTSVIIPEGVARIGVSAFQTCTALTEVSLPESTTEIGAYAFAECGALTQIDLPDGLANISGYTFEDCGALTGITLPSFLERVGDNAFNYCFALEDAFYPGTQEQWEQINVGNNNYSMTSTLRFAE